MPRLSAILVAAVCAPTLWAQFQFQFEPDQRAWTLENGVIRAVFQLSEQGTFEFRSLSDVRTATAWTPAPGHRSSPIRLQVDDTFLDAHTSFRLLRQGSRAIERQGFRQTILLEELKGLGRVTLELEMYANQPVLRYRFRFQNTRPAAAKIRGADMLSWSFDDAGRSYRSFHVNQWVDGGRKGNFETFATSISPAGFPVWVESGAHGQHCAWLAVRDDADRGLFAGWEFDGRATAAVQHYGQERHLDLSGLVRNISRPIQWNEQFEAPGAFIGLFQGDWDEAGYRTQRFTEAVLAPPIPGDTFPYVMWDSWRYQQDIDEPTLRRNAEIAARLGVEAFIVDLGWARHIGDWHADPRKFPGGMRALSDYVRSLGMKFGLHFPLAEASAKSPVLLANPDWTSAMSYHYFDAESLCLGHKPVREWLIAEATRMIDEYRVDWILIDGENMVKYCNKTSHTHAQNDSNYANAVDGLNTVVTELQRRRPATLWENCQDGGNMMTFNMVRNFVTSIAADDSGPLTTRQAIYGVTYPLSPRYADRYMPDEELDIYKTRSYMFGGPWILMNRLASMREQDLELLSSEIQIYKRIRSRIRDGKVFHLTARPSELRIDALESYHEPTDSAIAFVFRGEAAPNSRLLTLRGLKAQSHYRVSFEEDQRTLIMSGEQLMREGIRIGFPQRWFAEIVYVEPVR